MTQENTRKCTACDEDLVRNYMEGRWHHPINNHRCLCAGLDGDVGIDHWVGEWKFIHWDDCFAEQCQ